MPRNEVFALIDEVTLSLQNAKKVPFTDSVMIHQGQMMDALKRIVTNYDPSLEKADKIIANEERIMGDAASAANKTMEEAQAQAQRMVSEANTYAQTTKAKTDTYAQYLNYHEGWGGYRRGSYRNKAWLGPVARKVEARAARYGAQYAGCHNELERGWLRRLFSSAETLPGVAPDGETPRPERQGA